MNDYIFFCYCLWWRYVCVVIFILNTSMTINWIEYGLNSENIVLFFCLVTLRHSIDTRISTKHLSRFSNQFFSHRNDSFEITKCSNDIIMMFKSIIDFCCVDDEREKKLCKININHANMVTDEDSNRTHFSVFQTK